MAYTLAGIVKDHNGVPCARTVRAYRREDGLLGGETVSDSATGAFAIYVGSSDPYTVLVLDDNLSPMLNALVFDTITPTHTGLEPVGGINTGYGYINFGFLMPGTEVFTIGSFANSALHF